MLKLFFAVIFFLLFIFFSHAQANSTEATKKNEFSVRAKAIKLMIIENKNKLIEARYKHFG